MGKNCVITLDPDVVNKASDNAHKQGKSLKEVIEGTIIDLAKNKQDGPWITEKALEALPWAPSRVSLYQMRKDKRLKVGVHYKRQGRFIFYNKEELQKALVPLTSASTNEPGVNATL
jgi:hypothetical protein